MTTPTSTRWWDQVLLTNSSRSSVEASKSTRKVIVSGWSQPGTLVFGCGEKMGGLDAWRDEVRGMINEAGLGVKDRSGAASSKP